MINKICFIGLGYVGLPTATMFAKKGVETLGVDINQHIVDLINQGKIHIVENDLEEVVKAVVNQGLLKASTKPEKADIFIVAVPTPINADKTPDISAVEKAFETLAPVLEKGNLVILESTSPVGTLEKMAQKLATLRADITFPHQASENSDIMLAYCPERILPGQTMEELIQNSRAIGGMDKRSAEKAKEVYEIFCKGNLTLTNDKTAEMVKLVENSYRDVNIAFANELSMICDHLGINVQEVIQQANLHPRVNILNPGVGVGGHCIPVDPWFIVDSAPEHAKLIRAAREVNDYKPNWIIKQIENTINQLIAEKNSSKKLKVGILGLTYKPNVDDLRESPALFVTKALLNKYNNNIELLICEPHIEHLPEELEKLTLYDPNSAIEQADLVLLLVSHKFFHDFYSFLSQKKFIIDVTGSTS